jgi:16S rRNA (guanine527-N7)-methyltransferase
MMMDIITNYFTDFSEEQLNHLDQLMPLYQDWNAKINVISRKDIDALYLHHVLHSLSIVPYYSFRSGAKILDLGTGGGFPGIPLAIFYPDVDFTLIDGTKKKLKVVQAVVDDLGLKNVQVRHIRAEELKEKFDMVVTRAVASAHKLLEWSRPLLKQKHMHAYPNGVIALKGGDIAAEMKELPRHEYFEYHAIKESFPEAYFDEKYVVYMQG